MPNEEEMDDMSMIKGLVLWWDNHAVYHTAGEKRADRVTTVIASNFLNEVVEIKTK